MTLRPTGQKAGKTKREYEWRGKLRKPATTSCIGNLQDYLLGGVGGGHKNTLWLFFPLLKKERPVVLTITKIWKQPKCPLRDKWIKKMSYMCMCVYADLHT